MYTKIKELESLQQEAFKLLITDATGRYIPQAFVESNDAADWGFNPSEWCWRISRNPDHENYWDAWSEILDHASHIDSNGNEWRLMQSGDLWSINDTLIVSYMEENEIDDLPDDFYPMG